MPYCLRFLSRYWLNQLHMLQSKCWICNQLGLQVLQSSRNLKRYKNFLCSLYILRQIHIILFGVTTILLKRSVRYLLKQRIYVDGLELELKVLCLSTVIYPGRGRRSTYGLGVWPNTVTELLKSSIHSYC